MSLDEIEKAKEDAYYQAQAKADISMPLVENPRGGAMFRQVPWKDKISQFAACIVWKEGPYLGAVGIVTKIGDDTNGLRRERVEVATNLGQPTHLISGDDVKELSFYDIRGPEWFLEQIAEPHPSKPYEEEMKRIEFGKQMIMKLEDLNFGGVDNSDISDGSMKNKYDEILQI